MIALDAAVLNCGGYSAWEAIRLLSYLNYKYTLLTRAREVDKEMDICSCISL